MRKDIAEEDEMSPKPRPEIFVSNHRQLLFDDFFLAMASSQHPDQLAHKIRWSLAKVEKHPEPIFFGEPPWEDSKQWFCILHDGGRYRLWYNSSVKSSRGLRVSYAESEDGLEWRRRKLKLVEWEGSKDNNLVYLGAFGVSYELGNVFIDPVGKPEERYKMVGAEWLSDRAFETPYIGAPGAFTAGYSADGIHWEHYWRDLLGRYPDSQNVASYDPVLEKYVAYIRSGNTYGELSVGEHPVRGAGRGRGVGRIESEEFTHWPGQYSGEHVQIALAADIQDGLNVDVYNSGYSRYPEADNAHFMFPSFYHHWEGTFLVQVAVSRDNRRWVRPTREVFIPLGEPGSFDCHILSVAPGFVPIDKDHYALYYRSGNMPHGGAHPSVAKPEKPVDGMGRVVLKRDRVVGIEAGPEEGTFSTRRLLFEGRRLVLNVEPTGPDPCLVVQILSGEDDEPLAGFTFEDSVPLREDNLDAVVSWKKGAELGELGGKPVRLHFRLRSMRIYAFQFAE